MSNKSNKVYINPNFKGLSVPIKTMNKIEKIHVNPFFSKPPIQNKSKVYVNPNFVHSKNQVDYANYCATSSSEITTERPLQNTSEVMPISLNSHKALAPITMSRYSIVRKPTVAPPQSQITRKVTTVKVNRYKSITICNLQNTINTQKSSFSMEPKIMSVKTSTVNTANYFASKPMFSEHTPQLESKKLYKYKNKYKLCKRNSALSLLNVTSTSLNSKAAYLNRRFSNLKAKSVKKGNMKKNNIPCPLFKKYGKCLRSKNGICEFLHDKKQVSICRQFLKGLCQNKSCLLSHDITDKKMPTCYFYLKGNCTKDHCQYLHVKLNEKSKVCIDFLKGYCEKGDSCLHRHVYVNKKNKCDLAKDKMQKSFTNRRKINKVYKHNVIDDNKNLPAKENVATQGIEKVPSESRYYKEFEKTVSNEISETIKPSRCKLGVLPSYIKL